MSKKTTKQAAGLVAVAPMAQGDNGNYIELKPQQIRASNNVRYGTLPSAVEDMVLSIKDRGGIKTPVTVMRLPEPDGEFTHELAFGFTRHAAALKLAEEGIEILVPAIETTFGPKELLLTQIDENERRNSFTPIDRARAMKALQDMGFSVPDIQQQFRTAGGKKGTTLGPCSMSYVYKTLRLLEYPKNMQERIHDGRIDQAAAFAFQTYDRAKWPDMLKELETRRLKAVEKQEAEDEKLAKSTAKETAVVEATSKLDTDIAAAEAKVNQTEEEIKAATAAAAEALKKSLDRKALTTAEAKKAATEALNRAQAEAKKASEASAKAEKELLNLRAKKDAVAKRLQAAKDAIAQRRATAGTTTVSDVHAAATATGAAPTPAKLSSKDREERCKDIGKPYGYPKTDVILEAIHKCLYVGSLSVAQLCQVISGATGEVAAKVKKTA